MLKKSWQYVNNIWKEEVLTLKTLNSFPPLMTRTEVDFEELRQYVKQVFEEEYGNGNVAKVEAAQYNPYMINIAIYVREKKADMRDLCVNIAHTKIKAFGRDFALN